MHGPVLLVLLLAAITAIAIIARQLKVPYPIAFVLGGLAIAFVPNQAHFSLNPDLVFVVFLPPLLFSGGWSTDLLDFKKNLRPILLLATGLVVATTVVVALIANVLAPELTLASAFVLGAIISPPDAVAASNVFERFSVPRRVMTLLEGEGLVNDATALVIYALAVEAVQTGHFSLSEAALWFIGVAVGGVAIGLLFGWLIVKLLVWMRERDYSNTLIDNLLAIGIPYAVYILGNACHVSGVLSTVVAGIYASRQSSRLYTAEARLTVSAVWELLIFFLNATVFLLIGLELPAIMPSRADVAHYLIIGGLVSLVIIAVRIAWVFPGAYLPHLIPQIRRNETRPDAKSVLVIGWSGMRGVVSLAAALALPETTGNGQPFPGRTLILLVTFCVIFVTLVIQGLSLIPLLKILKLDGEDLASREKEVRVAALEAGMQRLHELEREFTSTDEWEVQGRILAEYRYRIGYLRGSLQGDVNDMEVAIDHRFQREALEAEHARVLNLRDAGEIPDEVFRRIRYDLDLAETRLA